MQTLNKDWLFELAYSSSLTKFAEITTAKNRTLTLTLDRAGQFTFSVHLEDEIANLIQEVTTCVLVKRRQIDGSFQTVWSGPVWGLNESTPNSLDVTCIGWLQTLEKRQIKTDQTFIDTDAGQIALDLLTILNTESNTSGVPFYVNVGTVESTINRSRIFKAYENYTSIIQGLSDIESGIDFWVDPESRDLNIYAHFGEVRQDLIFEYPNNISGVSRSSDTSRLCNRMTVFGGPGTIAQQANDEVSQAIYGIFEESISLTDVKDNTILQAYGAAEVIIRAYPLRIYSFSTKRAGVNTNVPRLFKDFGVGDTGYLTINKGSLQVFRQAVRVFNISLSFDDNGNEQSATIQTTVQ